jgi:hypothetical protein
MGQRTQRQRQINAQTDNAPVPWKMCSKIAYS